MNPTCATCRHHRGEPVGAGLRECRALPPCLGQETHGVVVGSHPVMLALWPLTRPEDGCGGHESIGATPAATAPTPAVAAEQPRRKGKG